MGTNNSSLTPLNCILKNCENFDPQGLKKTHLVFLYDTAWPRYPLEDRERWPVGGCLKYNTVLQLDGFCKKQGKWVKVVYVLTFFSLRNMSDLCPKGVNLGETSAPPTTSSYFAPVSGAPSWGSNCFGLSGNTNWDSNCFGRSRNTNWDSNCSVTVGTQIEIRTAHVEVQTTPVSVWLQTTLVSVETQTFEVRGEREDRRQRDKEKQVSPVYPWDMRRAARETEGQPLMLLPLHEVPTRRNYQSMRVNKPFSYQELRISYLILLRIKNFLSKN